jgi:hypothetical protein
MNPPPAAPPMRWGDYVLLRSAEVGTFWSEYLKRRSRDLLVVLGRGFDPRACLGIRALMGAGGAGRRDVVALEFVEGEHSPAGGHADLAASNWADIQATVAGKAKLISRTLPFRSSDGRRAASLHAAELFDSLRQLTGYTDVVVDVSAMPRAVFFPLLARLLFLLDEARAEGERAANLHVLTAEDSALDAQIREEGIDETAGFLHSFEGKFGRESGGQQPRVWVPLLGEGKTTQFDRIHDHVKPDEICPVVPSPSRVPRRGDNIVREYRGILFDQIGVDPRNIIYASEENPFEVYRRVRQAALQYHRVLRLLGGCKIALSVLSSKLMSLGALLVAYEMKGFLDIGVAHVECQGYTLHSRQQNAELVGMWLSGECYEC